MKLYSHKFLADENIQTVVVEFMRNSGVDVLEVRDTEYLGSTDTELLRIAYQENRIMLTHDSDFGTLAIANKEPIFAIVYLKPGHIKPFHTIESIRAILEQEDLIIPSIITVKNTGYHINIRIRKL